MSSLAKIEQEFAEIVAESDLLKNALKEQEAILAKHVAEKAVAENKVAKMKQLYRNRASAQEELLKNSRKQLDQKLTKLNQNELNRRLKRNLRNRERMESKRQLIELQLNKYDLERICREMESEMEVGDPEEEKELLEKCGGEMSRIRKMIRAGKRKAKSVAISARETIELCAKINAVCRHNHCMIQGISAQCDGHKSILIEEKGTGEPETKEQLDSLHNTFSVLNIDKDTDGSTVGPVCKNKAWQDVHQLRARVAATKSDCERLQHDVSEQERKSYERTQPLRAKLAQLRNEEQELLSLMCSVKSTMDKELKDKRRIEAELEAGQDHEALMQNLILGMEAMINKLRSELEAGQGFDESTN